MEQVLKAIYSVLDSDGNITADLYPVVAPENATFPCIVYWITGVTPHGTKSGASTIDHVFVTVAAFAENTESESGYLSAANMGEAIRTALDRINPGTYSGIGVDGIDFLDGDIGYDGESDVYVVTLDFKVRVNRLLDDYFEGEFMQSFIITEDTGYTAAHANRLIIIDASSNSVQYSLPASPNDNLEITFIAIDTTYPATLLATGGKDINSETSTYQFYEQFASITLKWVEDLGYWLTKNKE